MPYPVNDNGYPVDKKCPHCRAPFRNYEWCENFPLRDALSEIEVLEKYTESLEKTAEKSKRIADAYENLVASHLEEKLKLEKEAEERHFDCALVQLGVRRTDRVLGCSGSHGACVANRILLCCSCRRRTVRLGRVRTTCPHPSPMHVLTLF